MAFELITDFFIGTVDMKKDTFQGKIVKVKGRRIFYHTRYVGRVDSFTKTGAMGRLRDHNGDLVTFWGPFDNNTVAMPIRLAVGTRAASLSLHHTRKDKLRHYEWCDKDGKSLFSLKIPHKGAKSDKKPGEILDGEGNGIARFWRGDEERPYGKGVRIITDGRAVHNMLILSSMPFISIDLGYDWEKF